MLDTIVFTWLKWN